MMLVSSCFPPWLMLRPIWQGSNFVSKGLSLNIFYLVDSSLQVFEGEEIQYWESKTNVGWYASMENRVWCWLYSWGNCFEWWPSHWGCNLSASLLVTFLVEQLFCYFVSFTWDLCDSSFPIISPLLMIIVRILNIMSWMRSWSITRTDFMVWIRMGGLSTFVYWAKLMLRSLCKWQRWIAIWNTMCRILKGLFPSSFQLALSPPKGI